MLVLSKAGLDILAVTPHQLDIMAARRCLRRRLNQRDTERLDPFNHHVVLALILVLHGCCIRGILGWVRLLIPMSSSLSCCCDGTCR